MFKNATRTYCQDSPPYCHFRSEEPARITATGPFSELKDAPITSDVQYDPIVHIKSSGNYVWCEDLYERVGKKLDERTKSGAIDGACEFTEQMIPNLEAAANHPDMTEELADIFRPRRSASTTKYGQGFISMATTTNATDPPHRKRLTSRKKNPPATKTIPRWRQCRCIARSKRIIASIADAPAPDGPTG